MHIVENKLVYFVIIQFCYEVIFFNKFKIF